MKIICMERGAGKTSKLIRLAAQDNLCIVCLNSVKVSSVLNLAKSLGFRIPIPVSMATFLTGRASEKGIAGFVIDDLDQALDNLGYAFGMRAVSITKNIPTGWDSVVYRDGVDSYRG